MGLVMFYHLTQSRPQGTLLAILPRALQAQWRVLIRADAPVLADLDEKLWGGAGETFLPHGLAGGAHDADQPILLGNVPSADFDALALVGAAPCDMAEAQRLHRVWVLFDGNSAPELTAARALWRHVAEAGLHAQYWSEQSGTWAMKTAANAPAKL